MMSTGMTVSISSAPLARITNALFAAMVELRSATRGEMQLKKSADRWDFSSARLISVCGCRHSAAPLRAEAKSFF